MKRKFFVPVIAGCLILLLSNSGNVSAQNLAENRSAMNITDAAATTSGLVNYNTRADIFSEEVKETGKKYSDNVNTDPFFIAGIPGRVEAENWDVKSGGMYALPTTDPTGGNMMVVGIANGDFMDYNVNVASTGTYTVGFRVATTQFPVFQLKLGNTVLATFNITSTGDWNIWQTFTVTGVPLTAGAQTLRVVLTTSASANFNWIDFSLSGGNQLPVANAGPDQTINLPTNSVTLAGSGTDDGTITAYQWTKISGPAGAIIVSPTTASTAVNNLVEGVYQFELKVTDNALAIATDIVVITVNPAAAAGNWDLAGNSGTNPATNFLGTTDVKRLVFRTSNTERMTLGTNGFLGVGVTNPLAKLHVSNGQGAMTGFPYESAVIEHTGDTKFSVLSSDISGVGGAAIVLGHSNFTVGGLYPGYEMQYGINNGSSFLRFDYIQRGANGIVQNDVSNIMILSDNSRVGVNLGPTGGGLTPNRPTANFHTNGTLRFQGLPTGTGNVLVVDANGNVFRSATAASSAVNAPDQVELKNKIEKLEEEIESLRSLVNSMKSGTLDIDVNRDNPLLYQNTPNPFNSTTTIRYYLPSGFQKAVLEISDLQGKVLKNYQLTGEGKQSATINANELSAGTYIYTLIVNEKRVDSKKMILTR